MCYNHRIMPLIFPDLQKSPYLYNQSIGSSSFSAWSTWVLGYKRCLCDAELFPVVNLPSLNRQTGCQKTVKLYQCSTLLQITSPAENYTTLDVPTASMALHVCLESLFCLSWCTVNVLTGPSSINLLVMCVPLLQLGTCILILHNGSPCIDAFLTDAFCTYYLIEFLQNHRINKVGKYL